MEAINIIAFIFDVVELVSKSVMFLLEHFKKKKTKPDKENLQTEEKKSTALTIIFKNWFKFPLELVVDVKAKEGPENEDGQGNWKSHSDNFDGVNQEVVYIYLQSSQTVTSDSGSSSIEPQNATNMTCSDESLFTVTISTGCDAEIRYTTESTSVASTYLVYNTSPMQTCRADNKSVEDGCNSGEETAKE